MKKNIFLTGATGFIGQELIKYLHDFDVVFYKRGDHVNHFSDIKFDYIVHLAGKAHDKGATWSDFEINNINLTQDVVNLADENTKIIYFSSAKVYGETSIKPLVENVALAAKTDYGVSKVKAEKIVQDSSLNYIIFRPSLVYSANAKGNLEALRKLARLGVPMPLNIYNRRSLVELEFLVKVTLLALQEKIKWNEVYNLSNLTVSTVDIFKLNGIKRFVPYPTFLLSVLPNKLKEKLLMSFELDCQKLMSQLNNP